MRKIVGLFVALSLLVVVIVLGGNTGRTGVIRQLELGRSQLYITS